MAQNNQRERALEVIRENIACSGHHTYVVSAGGQTPRFAYTIGVSESIGVELILAGAIFYPFLRRKASAFQVEDIRLAFLVLRS